jgi:hypothetical protein
MSGDPLYFFSYSRQELYFAEAAVLALQQAGLNIWFDLQQLEPGCNWSEEIQRGLQDCAGVILLASHASLNSPWVALEWEHALEKGKPIYVLLFEAVKFDAIPASEATNNQPIPLDRLREQAAAILDVRRHFHKNMVRLASVVKNAGTDHDPIPLPNRWRIPTVMPYAVALVTLSLALTTVVMLWMSLYGFSIYWPMMLAGLAITAWSGSRTIAFLRRRSFREARAILPIALIISPFVSLVLTPVLALGTLLVLRSPDVNRWSPLGQGIDRGRYKAPIPQNVTPPRTWLERLAHGYVDRLGRLVRAAGSHPGNSWDHLPGSHLSPLGSMAAAAVGLDRYPRRFRVGQSPSQLSGAFRENLSGRGRTGRPHHRQSCGTRDAPRGT